MYDEAIKLVALTKSVDDYGDITTTETERSVFARLASVTQSEFYQAEAVGLKPQIKFVIADYLDYNFEQIIRYQPFNGEEQTFTVLRTYRNGLELEITCKRGID